jgi:hypothetical protein
MGSYQIAQVVLPLSYKFTLPDWLKIYPIISIDHLEKRNKDPYERELPGLGPIVKDGEEKYIVNKIIRKEMCTEPGRESTPARTGIEVCIPAKRTTTAKGDQAGLWRLVLSKRIRRSCWKI